MSRKSIALYYFTNGRPKDEVFHHYRRLYMDEGAYGATSTRSHITLWYQRPGEKPQETSNEPTYLRRVRNLIYRYVELILPPIIPRSILMLKRALSSRKSRPGGRANIKP